MIFGKYLNLPGRGEVWTLTLEWRNKQQNIQTKTKQKQPESDQQTSAVFGNQFK